MDKGTYIGSDSRLKGKTALLLPGMVGYLQAQFDDVAVQEAFGWWSFPIADFKIHEKIGC